MSSKHLRKAAAVAASSARINGKSGEQEKSAKELAMMNEENDNMNNNNNNEDNYEFSTNVDNQYLLQQTTTATDDSRSSSALWSSESEELNSHCSSGRSSSAAKVIKSCDDEDELKMTKNDFYSSNSSSTSGAEEDTTSSQGPSPSPELTLENVAVDDDDVENENESEKNYISQDKLKLAKQINSHSNLIPETKQVNQIVDQIRIKFLDNLKAKQCADLYEEFDIQELRKELPKPEHQEQSLAFRLISRFLQLEQLENTRNDRQLSEKELVEVIEKLDEFLKFRHHYQVPQIKSDQFCQEFFLLYGMFPFGYDRQNLPILYTRANVHRRWSEKLDESFRRYVAWQVDLMTKSSETNSFGSGKIKKAIGYNGIEKDGSFGICFDCVNVSYSCVDMDFLRFIVKLLVHCYPTYCRYALCVDLPWLFRSVWQLVRSWLPEEARETVQLITSKQLLDYIDEEQIPYSIKIGNNSNNKQQVDRKQLSIGDKRKHKVPENFKSIRNFNQFAKELELSSSEVKSFKAHMEKVMKQYREVGALPSIVN